MASSKLDMSLDDIIKMQKKNGENTGSGLKRRGGVKRGPSLSLRNRARGVRSTRGTTAKIAKGAIANSAVAQRKNSRARGVRSALRKPVGQRVARTLVKRAMLSNRRQAIAANRNSAPAHNTPQTRRLAEQVRQWRNTAKLLHNALQVEATKNLRMARPGRGGNKFSGSVVLPISPNGNSVQGRLGWTNARGRQPGNNNNVRRFNNQNRNSIRSTGLGSLRSDEVSRENERLKRITADVLARYENEQGPRQSRGSRPSFPARRFNNTRGRFNSNTNFGRGRQQSNSIRGGGGFRGNGPKSFRGRRDRYFQ